MFSKRWHPYWAGVTHILFQEGLSFEFIRKPSHSAPDVAQWTSLLNTLVEQPLPILSLLPLSLYCLLSQGLTWHRFMGPESTEPAHAYYSPTFCPPSVLKTCKKLGPIVKNTFYILTQFNITVHVITDIFCSLTFFKKCCLRLSKFLFLVGHNPWFEKTAVEQWFLVFGLRSRLLFTVIESLKELLFVGLCLVVCWGQLVLVCRS